MTGSDKARRPLAFILPDFRGGGAERVALYLIKRFVALDHRVDLVLMNASGELLRRLPPEVRVIDLKAPRFRSAIFPLALYLKRERPHSAQVRMWPLTIAAILAKMLSRSATRLIVSDHAPLTSQYGQSRAAMRALKWSTKLFYPSADARVAVSHGVAKDLARLSGLETSDFEVIYNPVAPVDSISLVSGDIAWGSKTKGVARIITVGAMKAAKNQIHLIRAFTLLRQRRPAKLMIVGEGDLRSVLLSEGERLGISADLIMPGFVEDPAPLIASADLFVLTSHYEGFGNVLIEAMRVGVPVVSTDCPSGPAEIVDGGRYGALVPCGDEIALAAAMESSLDVHPSPEALKVRAEQLSGEESVQRYIELMK